MEGQVMDIPHGSVMLSVTIAAGVLIAGFTIVLISWCVDRVRRADAPDALAFLVGGVLALAGFNGAIVTMAYVWFWFWQTWGRYP